MSVYNILCRYCGVVFHTREDWKKTCLPCYNKYLRPVKTCKCGATFKSGHDTCRSCYDKAEAIQEQEVRARREEEDREHSLEPEQLLERIEQLEARVSDLEETVSNG